MTTGGLLYRISNWIMRRRTSRLSKQRMLAWNAMPGLSFEVGDRVKAIHHLRIDDDGGTGTIIESDCFHRELGINGVLVQFDSFPQVPLFMSASELVYER